MSDPDKNSVEAEYEQCASHCPHGDFVCFAKCSDDYDENFSKCPCQSKCPSGCPCPEYECESESERTDVLILSTWKEASVPVLTNADAYEDKDFHFDIDQEAEVDRSCSLTWENECTFLVAVQRRPRFRK